MKFDRNEKTIKMALSFSESDDFENFTKISVVVWYMCFWDIKIILTALKKIVASSNLNTH